LVDAVDAEPVSAARVIAIDVRAGVFGVIIAARRCCGAVRGDRLTLRGADILRA
jgi:hypothetical protein